MTKPGTTPWGPTGVRPTDISIYHQDQYHAIVIAYTAKGIHWMFKKMSGDMADKKIIDAEFMDELASVMEQDGLKVEIK